VVFVRNKDVFAVSTIHDQRSAVAELPAEQRSLVENHPLAEDSSELPVKIVGGEPPGFPMSNQGIRSALRTDNRLYSRCKPWPSDRSLAQSKVDCKWPEREDAPVYVMYIGCAHVTLVSIEGWYGKKMIRSQVNLRSPMRNQHVCLLHT